MEEKYLQKQQEYTFTVPRAEGQKVYHIGMYCLYGGRAWLYGL